jgi:hypothetical protein
MRISACHRVGAGNPLKKAVADHTALGRVGAPEDVGMATASFLSDEYGWINAQRATNGCGGGMEIIGTGTDDRPPTKKARQPVPKLHSACALAGEEEVSVAPAGLHRLRFEWGALAATVDARGRRWLTQRPLRPLSL